MSGGDRQARVELIEAIGGALNGIADALALAGEAYEHLDEIHAEDFEGATFKPLQRAFALATRARGEYAQRNGLQAGAVALPPQPAPGSPVKVLINGVLDAIAGADQELIALQDSLLLVELGDPNLRRALGDVRGELETAGKGSRALLHTFGR